MAVGEWDERQLCPDGSCVGVIGDNGHCKVCNRVATNWGNERDRGLRAKSATDAPIVGDDELGPDEEWDDEDEGDEEDDHADDDDTEGNEEAEKLAELDPSTPSLIGAPAEWTKRILCSDGACIGVIGADGRCKVCGKPAKGEAPAASADIDHDSGSLADRDDGDATAGDDDDDDDDEGEDEDDEDGDDEDDDDDEESADDDKRSAAAAGERATGKPTAGTAVAAPSSVAGAAATAAALDAELLAAANDMAAALPKETDFDRKLCPDGACVGVIGDNGRCRICGKEAA